jgi:ankyrin repeat protein
LHYAAGRNDIEMVNVLLRSKANIHARNKVSPVSPA